MKRILIADDAAFMRAMLKDVLEKGGYQVIGEAKNGKEAADKVKELSPDLVTMDITMPEVDGITGVKLIREFNNDVKIIMCSAMGQQAMVIEAINAGACDFIVKPFQADKILNSIAKALT